MSVADLPFVAVMLVLVGLSATFSAAETAIFSITPGERSRLDPKSRLASLLADPSSLLVTVLLLNMSVNVLYFVISSVLTMRAEGTLAKVSVPVVSLVVLVLFGEILAKLLASAHKIRYAHTIAPVIDLVRALVAPALVALLRFVITPMTRLVSSGGGRPGVEELNTLLERAAGTGALSHGEHRLLGEVVALGDISVREIMVPRVDMTWAEAGIAIDALRDLVRESGLVRFPVYEGSIDKGSVLGFVDARRVLTADIAGRDLSPRDMVDDATFLPDSARLDGVLRHFRSTGSHVALVVDEHGTIVGLVEIEDVVGRLVPASSDRPEEERAVQMVGIGRWLVSGRLPLREWGHVLGDDWRQIERHVTTVGGLLMTRLGRAPEPGEEVRVGDVLLRVARLSGRSIESVELSLANGEGDA